MGKAWICRAVTTAGGTVVLHRAPPDANTGPHRTASPVLAVVLRGRCVTSIGRQTLDAARGAAWIEPGDDLCRNVAGPQGAQLLSIALDGDLRAAGLDRLPALFTRPQLFRDMDLVSEARRAAAELRRADTFSEMALTGHALGLLATVGRTDARSRKKTAAPRWLTTVREQLRATFRDPMDLAALAATAGVSTAHLSRVFHSHEGVSIGGYVRTLRLEWAVEQLERGRTTLGRIATAAGFYDQSHLSREFRRRFGASPLDYRRRCAESPRPQEPTDRVVELRRSVEHDE